MKYLFIITVLGMLLIVGVFVYFARKLDYMIPKTVNIEVYDAGGTQFLSLYGDKKEVISRLRKLTGG